MTEGEKLDKFVQGLKHNVRLEVLKSTESTFENASSIALRVDSALQYFEDTNWNLIGPDSSGFSPIEIEDWKNRKR